MDEQNSGFILCDISFNGQLIADVKLPKACSMGNIVQGLWLDDNFRKNGLAYLKAKDEEAEKKDSEVSTVSLKCIRGIDRCILRAYGELYLAVLMNIFSHKMCLGSLAIFGFNP